MKERQTNFKIILLAITIILFSIVIKDYIIPIVLAAIITGLLQPTNIWFLKKFKGKKNASALITTLLFLMMIIIPSAFLVALIYNEASTVSQSLSGIIHDQSIELNFFDKALPDWFPLKEQLEPFKEKIYAKIGELAGMAGSLFMQGLSSLTQGTLLLFVNLFVLLYALYFFLIDSDALKKRMLNTIPLSKWQTQLLIDNTLSISRATLKGAVLVGMVQGALVGLSFWVAGIGEPLFWGTLAALMSLLPSIGSAIVYIPGGIYLLLTGNIPAGIGVLLWGFGVVSTIDNVLRPKLVGKDTELPDLLILISTLGGIGLFGLSGLILGPIIAGLLMTSIEIFNNRGNYH